MYKGIFMNWCRNVGEKHKTFFGEGGGGQDSETKNIGLLGGKPPYF